MVLRYGWLHEDGLTRNLTRFLFKSVFIYFWLCWVLIAVQAVLCTVGFLWSQGVGGGVGAILAGLSPLMWAFLSLQSMDSRGCGLTCLCWGFTASRYVESFWIRGHSRIPGIGSQIPDHRATREAPRRCLTLAGIRT